MSKKAVISTFIVAFCVGVVLAIVYGWITNTATIVSPASLTFEPQSLAWGNVTPGSVQTKTLLITNTGMLPTGPLHLIVEWVDPQQGTLTWDFEGQTLAAGEAHTVTFTLTVYADATSGPLNFNVGISS